MDKSSTLTSRYSLERELGRGGCAITWLARPLQDETRQVVIKELQFEKLGSWQDLEQFETEARLLEHLDHPNIPAFIDFLSEETPEGKRLYLVQEWIEGQDLDSLLKSGKYFTEAEAIAIARAICAVLIYLHAFSPPIVHRDLKPGNIMLRARDSKIYLIDFGAVRGPLTSANTGLTVTGTFGYMPLEQLEGRTVPVSDLYALGMSLIHLLARQEPVNLPKQGLKLDFMPHLNVSERFARILDRLIEPDPSQRYPSAKEALTALEALAEPDSQRKTPAPDSSQKTRKEKQRKANQGVHQGVHQAASKDPRQQPHQAPRSNTRSARIKGAGDWKLPVFGILTLVGVGVLGLMLLGGPPEPKVPAAAAASPVSTATPVAEQALARLAEAERYRAQGQTADCVAAATQAGELQPGSEPAQLLRGLCLFDQKQYTQAETAFAKALEANPASGEAYYHRGLAFEQTGQDLDAFRAYRSASMMPPRAVEALYRLARLHERWKQPKEALSLYTRAIKTRPDPIYLLARGKLQRQLKSCPAARQDFSAACALKLTEACKQRCP